MRSSRLLKMLILGLSAVATVEAQMGPRVPGHGDVERRQTAGGDTADSASSSSSSSVPATSSSSSSSSSSTPTHSSSSSRSSSSAGATPTSPTPTPTSTPTGPTPTPSDSSQTSATVETITQVVTTTDGNGVPTTFTTATTSTSTPGLAGGSSSNQPSGMSPQTKNVVIGVVVGVGGAIILGALAVVAWRIWGRKKQAEDNDELMTYPSSAGEKPDTSNSMSGRTPFQSTLESYHAPTQVNTASNF
ncbi:hypothetical protein QBC47DRAFT_143498 [Echria macrotheca]|uniref:Mid2 domain-containing protein n=1 Tax=Echria macrotheca TaxID=438768 RepID=A0AAJ0F8Y7_9PEZI|nr:hypothetical protein QBC47DRAFT_143498 [Echria macrotheca]